MSRIHNPSSLINRTSYGPGAALLALPFIVTGSFFAGTWLGFWPLPGKANAPMWVIGLVGICFAAAGLALLLAGLRGWRNQRRIARATHPWEADYPWTPEYVPHNPYAQAPKHLFAVLFLILFMAPFNWWAFFSGQNIWMLRAIIGLFDLIILLGVGFALYKLAQAGKYGISRLYLPSFPLYPAGRLRFGLDAPRFEQVRVLLRYVHEEYVTTGAGRNRSATLHAHALVEVGQSLHWPAGRGILPIEIDWPGEPAQVNQLRAEPDVRYWELVVEAEDPGIDYHAAFPLPVYDAPASHVRRNHTWAERRAKRRIPYAFELGVPLALLALWGALSLLAPGATGSAEGLLAGLANRVHGTFVLRAAEPVRGSAMQVAFDASGQGWLLTKYGLVRGDEVVLEPRRFRDTFGGKHPAFSALTVTSPASAWIGSWKGDLFRFQQGNWSAHLRGGAPIDNRILALAVHGGDLWIGTSRGLWLLPAGAQSPRALSVPRVERVNDIEVLASGVVRIALGQTVQELGGGAGWRELFRADAEVLAIASTGANLYVGTRRGLIRYQAAGVAQQVGPADAWVRQIVPAQDRVYVATWNRGLILLAGDRWQAVGTGQGLPDPAISSVAISTTGAAWLALYKKGLVETSRTTLEELAR